MSLPAATSQAARGGHWRDATLYEQALARCARTPTANSTNTNTIDDGSGTQVA